MAPLENGGFQQSLWDSASRPPVDSLMRALLYITQQIGRPVSEAEWAANVDRWLPSDEDRAYVASLMGRVVEPGPQRDEALVTLGRARALVGSKRAQELAGGGAGLWDGGALGQWSLSHGAPASSWHGPRVAPPLARSRGGPCGAASRPC